MSRSHEEIAQAMQDIGYNCDVDTVAAVAAYMVVDHPDEEEPGPIPDNAALAANIAAALAEG